MKQPRLPLSRPSPYRRWYARDNRELRDLAAAGLTYSKIASRMGRSKRAIQERCRRLHIAVRSAAGNPWTDAERAQLLEEAHTMLSRCIARLGGSHPVSTIVDKAFSALVEARRGVRDKREVA